ncbi:MAG TPA: TraR/DksA C4-type zinc finger protein [Spirochaetota bacterium]|nr:TraR/DksA C4-type zinc finger protein [Spirochaetota bacterium]HPN82553.1 TraR/DksA C4-type zinc finger protein [Spirochaetota bacterium]
MNKKDTKKYEKILEEKKKQIITELLRDNEDYSGLSDESMGDLVDQAYKMAEKDLIFGMGQNEKATLQMIDAALERIADGSFGSCIACGQEIEPKRLEIMPYALKCIKCKTAEEKEFMHTSPQSESLQQYIGDDGLGSDPDESSSLGISDSLD